MPKIKTKPIPFIPTRKVEIENAQKAIAAVKEAVRLSQKADTSKVEIARAAYRKAIDDAIRTFDKSESQ